MKTILYLLAIVALITGCASAGKNYDSRKVTDIKKGETTEAELVGMFGKPETRGINSEGSVTLTWLYSEAHVKGATFVPLVGMFAGGVNSKTKTLLVRLDSSGKVASYDYSGGGFETSNAPGRDPEDGTMHPANTPASAGKKW